MGVLQHHEKINGKGYPLGFSSDKISLYAKILSVADIYDALVTERSYKKAFSKRDAVEMIMSLTNELDIAAMRSFLGSVILYPVDSIVQLSNGEKAKVVENTQESILRPKVVGLTFRQGIRSCQGYWMRKHYYPVKEDGIYEYLYSFGICSNYRLYSRK